MAPTPESPSTFPVELGFSVSHQKVDLDIDLLSRSLRGKTELVISPHTRDLKEIRLNCRQCSLKFLTVNGKPSQSVKYDDVYQRARLPWKAGVRQYHMLQERLEKSIKDPPEEELVIAIPKSVRLDELDPFSDEAQSLLLSKTLGSSKGESDASIIDPTHNPRTAVEQAARFTPIALIIHYEVQRLRDGIHFVGFEEGDLRYPHAFTTNSAFPGSACCLFPCLDSLNARCTWEISVRCAKTVGDIFHRVHAASPKFNGANIASKGQPKGEGDERLESFTDEDRNLELTVICNGDMTDEILDVHDTTKKTTSFVCSKDVSAQHLGLCIGPFEQVDLAAFRESDEDERLGQNAIPVIGFCLPGRSDEVKNTCFPLAKAVDFFTIQYGSYPYSSYKLCFIDDAPLDVVHTATLSICSTRLLFPEHVLEPIDRVTRQLIHALASQWIGIDVVAKEPADTWAVIGIAYYMTDTFIRKLSGKNDYRYKQKKAADRVVELDVDRPSLTDMGALLGLDPSELEFMVLKAPLVLFMLDQRMVKGGAATGLSRIISRIFLNAKVGEIPDGALDTAYFIKQCEKISHTKLEQFFAQWVEGAGCPKFRVSQKFNKKKLVVEMQIQQVQGENAKQRGLESSTFMRDVKEDLRAVYASPVQPCFTGPMTIRIHEADGTPYEHIVEINQSLQRLDIPYNTKYKRLKRSRRQKERTVSSTDPEYAGDDGGDVLLYSLGDVLQSEEDVKKWQLAEWSPDDEDRMSQESYEWIRMDADFEWICKISLTMPGYMWVSQLQQDRDVVAQLESIHYLELQKGHPLISTFLTRTLMDQRYFHGIRTSAAAALWRCAKDEIGWIGLLHLDKTFQEMFCYQDSSVTRPNDFSDRAAYLIQCSIPQAIGNVREADGQAPYKVRKWLFEKLRYNDNSNNEFSDSHYIAGLMKALATAMASRPAPAANDADDFDDLGGDDVQFHNSCLEEIDRHRRLDEWIPSHHNIVSMTALDCKRMLAKSGAMPIATIDFLQYTPDGTSDILRLHAFTNIMELGLTKNPAILRWFLFVLGTDPSPYMREQMLQLFGRTLGAIAIGEAIEPATASASAQEGLVVETEVSTEARKIDFARKQTVVGALQALKDELGADAVLHEGLWTAITSPNISLQQMWQLLEICDRLYIPQTSIVVALRLPRYWKCTKVGKGKVLFSQTDRVRTTPRPKPKRTITLKINPVSGGGADSAAHNIDIPRHPSPVIKEELFSGGGMAAPPLTKRKSIFKGPKSPSMQRVDSTSSVGSGAESPRQSEGEKPKRIILKLKNGGGGPASASPVP